MRPFRFGNRYRRSFVGPSHPQSCACSRARRLAFLSACAFGLVPAPVRAVEPVILLSDGDGPAVFVRYDVDPCSGKVAFDASESTGSAPGCRISRFHWWFGERKIVARPESRRPDPVYRFRTAGAHRVTLVVTDQCGTSHTATLGVHVPESLKSAEIDGLIRLSKQRVSVSESVTLLVVTEDRGTEDLAYEWDFGDGSAIDPNPRPTHFFGADGLYPVTVTLTDPCGRTATASTEILVGPVDPPPTIDVQRGRMIDVPSIQPGGGSADPTGRTEMQLPQPVVCGLSEAVSGIVASGERSEEDESVVIDTPDILRGAATRSPIP